MSLNLDQLLIILFTSYDQKLVIENAKEQHQPVLNGGKYDLARRNLILDTLTV